MERDEWNQIWGGEHPDHNHDENPHHHEAGPDSLLKDLVAGEPVGRALDLGCGMGANSIWLAEHGWQATGVDFSDVALDEARKAAEAVGTQARFVQGDLTSYEPVGQFDLITVFYVHFTQAEQQALLKRAAAALAHNGRLLFVGHDRSDSSWHGRIDDERLSTPDEVKAALEGLSIERAETIQHHVHGHDEAGTTVVVARRDH